MLCRAPLPLAARVSWRPSPLRPQHGRPALVPCSINCMHVLPDLAFLERKYAASPVAVVGVHSAKFDNEKDLEAIRNAGGTRGQKGAGGRPAPSQCCWRGPASPAGRARCGLCPPADARVTRARGSSTR